MDDMVSINKLLSYRVKRKNWLIEAVRVHELKKHCIILYYWMLLNNYGMIEI